MLDLTFGCFTDTDAAAVASARALPSMSTSPAPSCCHPAENCYTGQGWQHDIIMCSPHQLVLQNHTRDACPLHR
jgi:hypothetical protein